MKLIKLMLSGLLLSGLTVAQADGDVTNCEQYAKAAWTVDGKSPYGPVHPLCANGSVISDPHITTFSGLTHSGIGYDLNFPGDYTVTEVWGGHHLAIVGRFVVDKANKAGAFTIPEAFKLSWAMFTEHSLEIHRGDDGAVIFIDGKIVPLKHNRKVPIADVGYVIRKGESYFIADTTSDVAVIVNANKFYLDMNVTVPRTVTTVGLLGWAFAPALYDRLQTLELPFTPTDKDPQQVQVARADFIHFIDSWRLTDGNPFTTATLPEIPNYSGKIYTLSHLASKPLAKAQTQCDALEAELPERFDRHNCLFDLGFGGARFARSAHLGQFAYLRMAIGQ